MKYVVLLGDGMADYKISALGDRTPLQAAHKPNMDRLARASQIGIVKTIPDGFPPGSDVANLSVMGYEPSIYYTGRSPLEAVSMGVELGGDDVAFRCNLVTLSEEENYSDKTMVDYSSQEITTEEAVELVKAIDREIGSQVLRFHAGISYRHLLVWDKGQSNCVLTPPHDISDREIKSFLPKGAGAEILTTLMEKSVAVLSDHPVNKARIAKGLRPATSIWLWGQGKKPALTPFCKKFGVKGSVVCAVDLIKGLGLCAGLNVRNVQGATGNIHTNFRGKAEAALDELKKAQDFVYIHVEAPDEAGHQGNLGDKVKAIEEIDDKVLGTLLRGLDSFNEDYRVMILPDHPTPLSIKTHTSEIVPFMIYDSRLPADGPKSFNEDNARTTGIYYESGPDLMHRFIR